MEFGWFNIFNLTDFTNSGLVCKTLTYFLEGLGQVDIQVFKGNETSVQFGGEFMPIGFAGKNPYVSGDYAVFLDSETQDVYLGTPL